MADPEKIRIGDFVLEASRNLLRGLEGELVLEPKVVDVLLTLAAQPGVVLSRDALIDAVWKTEFGADERLTRAIYQLRRAFGDDRGTHRYIETVSKRGYRLVAAVEVVVEVMPAAAPPNGEASSLGPQTDAPPSADSPASHAAERPPPSSPARWWRNRPAYVTGAIAFLGIAALATWLWIDSGTRTTAYAEDVIELRPLVVIGDDPATDTFARQAHATLKQMFASSQLRVVERDDAPSQQPSQQSARKDSEFILSGTIGKTAGAFVVTLYFDDRAAGQTLWSHGFTRPATDEAALREEVGANTAYVIDCGLDRRTHAPGKPRNEAFMIYLETCDPKMWDDFGETALAKALRLVVVAPDDAYAHGLAAYAQSLLAMGRDDLASAQVDAYRTAARNAAARALELDPKNEYALLATAFLGTRVDYWLGLDAFRKKQVAILDPGLRQSGRLKEAIHLLDLEVARTPLSPDSWTYRAVLNVQAGLHEAADGMLAQALRLQPDHRGAHWYRFMSAAFYGRPEQALALLERDALLDMHLPGKRACWRAFIDARGWAAKRKQRAGVVRAVCTEYYRAGEQSARGIIMRMAAALGDVDSVYEMMQKETWETWRNAAIPLWYPEMAAVRRDARFMPLIGPTGLPEYWLRSGNWPDFCRDDVALNDCRAEARRALKDSPSTSGNDVESRSATDVVHRGSKVGNHD